MNFVMIANTAEAFAALLKKVAHTTEGTRRIRHELTLSQRAFFWGSDNKCVITSYPIPQALLRHNTEVCGYKNVTNLSPAEPTIALSRAVFKDQTFRQGVLAEIKRRPSAKLSPYAFTDDFRWLLRTLGQKRVMIEADHAPTQHSMWIAKYLDSKLGFRVEILKLITAHEFLRIPDGFIARNKPEALAIVEWLYASNRAAVVKVNFGESGWGLWICRVGEFQSSSAARDTLQSLMDADPVWKDDPLIVEEFIEADASVAGGSPSAELLIADEGSMTTYHCGQVLNEAGEFFGVEIGNGAVAPRTKAIMERVANVVGEHYHSLGYRGYCDIDFVAARDGELYAVETNPRRTGGTHVYDLAKHLFGEAWEERAYLISHDSFRYGNQTLKAESILERTQSLLYPIRGKSSGIIITSLNAWDPVLGYIVVGADHKEGRQLQQKFLSLFKD